MSDALTQADELETESILFDVGLFAHEAREFLLHPGPPRLGLGAGFCSASSITRAAASTEASPDPCMVLSFAANVSNACP